MKMILEKQKFLFSFLLRGCRHQGFVFVFVKFDRFIRLSFRIVKVAFVFRQAKSLDWRYIFFTIHKMAVLTH
jgi:hypothetical protein